MSVWLDRMLAFAGKHKTIRLQNVQKGVVDDLPLADHSHIHPIPDISLRVALAVSVESCREKLIDQPATYAPTVFRSICQTNRNHKRKLGPDRERFRNVETYRKMLSN